MQTLQFLTVLPAPNSSAHRSHSDGCKFFTTFLQPTVLFQRHKFTESNMAGKACRPLQATAHPPDVMYRRDERKNFTLDDIRQVLIRLEDSIIFNLLERAQYSYNGGAYDNGAFFQDGFQGSLVTYMVQETEKLHAKVGRYKSPDENPFFPGYLPVPKLPPMRYPEVLHHSAASININDKIWNVYFIDLLPRLAKEGGDGNWGSSTVCDTLCLQALSKRIHYGKFVAEAKFQESPREYAAAIEAKDRKRLMEMLTFEKVEAQVKERVEWKARRYGETIRVTENSEGSDPVYKMKPSLVANLYGDWIMPLTKEVEVEYLLRRLDD
ncbi:chorismate mutase 1, chloroplastic [Prosopis cineraria]|uniref:chorismate mutase 1, chloroplastic n=1 Tax=Prosopis cineraria TaxID=364024 RepID=UPI00240FCA62|nr:chorismate mutase 1, chloroplastic [Prosopis cineraria]